MITIKAHLVARKILAPDIHHLFFSTGEVELSYVPGQYAILTIPSSPAPVKRLYSFAGTNTHKNMFELLVKLVPGGAASEFLKNMNIGDAVEISGPAGLFAQQPTQSKKIYMVTGTGYAPVRSMLTSNSQSLAQSSLYWGLRDIKDVYMLEELLNFKQTSPLFTFSYCLSQQQSFELIPAHLQCFFRSGHIDVVWQAQNPTISPDDEYYLCGSRTVIESLRVLLLEKGVPKQKLFFEKY